MSAFARTASHHPWCELLACSRAGPSTRRPISTSTLARRASIIAPTWPTPVPAWRGLHTSHRRLVPPNTHQSQPPSSIPATPGKPTSVVTTDAPTTSTSKTQTAADWRIIRQLAVNIWPKGSTGTKVRVVGALGLLVAGKVLNVQVPFFFKDVVDSLNVPITAESSVWILAGASIAGCECFFPSACCWTFTQKLINADGAARVLTTAFGELRNAIFASISQGAIRKVARETFGHLLNMDMKFHLERQTGGLTRAIDRGTK